MLRATRFTTDFFYRDYVDIFYKNGHFPANIEYLKALYDGNSENGYFNYSSSEIPVYKTRKGFVNLRRNVYISRKFIEDILMTYKLWRTDNANSF